MPVKSQKLIAGKGEHGFVGILVYIFQKTIGRINAICIARALQLEHRPIRVAKEQAAYTLSSFGAVRVVGTSSRRPPEKHTFNELIYGCFTRFVWPIHHI